MTSTFNDMRKLDKESVIIDSNDGNSNQKVRFSNPNNEFYGKFTGDVEISSGTFSKEIIDSLSSTYQEKGNYISCSNLSSIDELSNTNAVKIWGTFKNGDTFRFYVLSGV